MGSAVNLFNFRWRRRVNPLPPKLPNFSTLCVECKKPIISHQPGDRIHVGCYIVRDNRDKAAQAALAQKRERIDEIKTALREFYEEKERGAKDSPHVSNDGRL